MADKKDTPRPDTVPRQPPKQPAFDEKPKPPLREEQIRKYDPMISDTFKPPPPKKR